MKIRKLLPIILALVILFSAIPAKGQTVVQARNTAGNATLSTPVTVSLSGTAAGNSIWAFGWARSGLTISAFTDVNCTGGFNVSFTTVTDSTGSVQSFGGYCNNIAGGSDVISVQCTAACGGTDPLNIVAVEVHGQNASTPLDNSCASTITASGGSNNLPSCSVTTSSTDLILTWLGSLDNGNFDVAPSGFTLVTNGSPDTQAAVAYQVSVAPGSISATWTSSSTGDDAPIAVVGIRPAANTSRATIGGKAVIGGKTVIGG